MGGGRSGRDQGRDKQDALSGKPTRAPPARATTPNMHRHGAKTTKYPYETCPMTLPEAARISIAYERDISAHQLLTGSSAKATAGEPTLPSVAGARSGCTASATSSHPGTPAWRRYQRPSAR